MNTKPDLKIIAQPEGFELRKRRADRAGSSREWSVQDAIYEAHRLIGNSENVDSVVVCWRENHSDGTFTTCYQKAGPSGHDTHLLVSILGKFMGWR